MAKVSRPIVYTLLGSLAVYAWFLHTQSDTASTHRKRITTATAQTADANGILPSDYTAHFPRYSASKRDPFLPKVLADTNVMGQGTNGGGWALTGINTLNGTWTAVVEDSSTSDSAFLKTGDHWMGLRVLSVQPDTVTFENSLGQETHLTFPVEATVPTPGPAAAAAPPPAPDAGASTVMGPGGVPVLPGIGGGFGRGGGPFSGSGGN